MAEPCLRPWITTHWLLLFLCFLELLFSLDLFTKMFTAWPYEAVGAIMGTVNTQQHEEQGRLDQRLLQKLVQQDTMA